MNFSLALKTKRTQAAPQVGWKPTSLKHCVCVLFVFGTVGASRVMLTLSILQNGVILDVMFVFIQLTVNDTCKLPT